MNDQPFHHTPDHYSWLTQHSTSQHPDQHAIWGHDHDGAYRQLPLAEPSVAYALLIAPDGPTLWHHHVLLFGSAASVWAYNRFGDVLTTLSRTLTDTLVLHYVDDYGAIEPAHLANSSFTAFEDLNGTLGFHMKQSNASPLGTDTRFKVFTSTTLPLTLRSNPVQIESLGSLPTYKPRSPPDLYHQTLPESWLASVPSLPLSYLAVLADLPSELSMTRLSPVMILSQTMPFLDSKHLPTSSNTPIPAMYPTIPPLSRWPSFILMPFANLVKFQSAAPTSYLNNRLNSPNQLPTDGQQSFSLHTDIAPLSSSDMCHTNSYYNLHTTTPSFTSLKHGQPS